MPYRETLHWTVGRYNQLFTDYHFLITFNPATKRANVVKGKFAPEANDVCKVEGKYAPHCKLGNTGNIGIGICAMYGYKDINHLGQFPITEEQFELACELMAECAIKYRFPITKLTAFTHHEHDVTLAKPDGKIDIIVLKFKPELKPEEVGNYMRNKIQVYYDRKTKSKEKLKYV